MTEPVANFQEAGSGDSVVCIHSSASTSGQWRNLMAALADRYRAIAVDLYGYGKSPAWSADRRLRLADEIDLIEPVLPRTGRYHLAGHSYGGAIALRMALDQPDRIASLALYEPTIPQLLGHGTAARLEIERVRDDAIRLVRAGDNEKAAEGFVGYWVGPDAWQAMAAPARAAVARDMDKVRFEWWSDSDTTWAEGCRQIPALAMPVLLLTGTRTTAAARGVIMVLRQLLPEAEFVAFDGAGHMGPLTHPGAVNREIAGFMDRVRRAC